MRYRYIATFEAEPNECFTQEVQEKLKNTMSLGLILLLFSGTVSLVTIGKDFSWKGPKSVLTVAMLVVFSLLFIAQLFIFL